jgi:hypothetical protein
LPELPRPKRPKRWNWRRQSAFLAKTYGVTFQVLNHHVDPHQIEKVRQALPDRALWPTGAAGRRFEPAA